MIQGGDFVNVSTFLSKACRFVFLLLLLLYLYYRDPVLRLESNSLVC